MSTMKCNYFLNYFDTFPLFSISTGILVHESNRPAVLESPWIITNSMSQKLGLCLTLSYFLPTYYGSISIILIAKANSSIWSLTGYQGSAWLNGKVSIMTDENFKV